MSDLPFVLLETFLKQCFLNGMRITWCHGKNNGIKFQEQLCYWFFFMLLKYSASFINQYNKVQSRWLLLLIRFDLDLLGLQLQGLICFWKEMRTLTWLGTRRGTEVNCLPEKKANQFCLWLLNGTRDVSTLDNVFTAKCVLEKKWWDTLIVLLTNIIRW